jgi:uncharacterized integral membrane protein
MFGLKVFKLLLKIPALIFCVAFVVLNMQDTTLYYSPIANPVTLPLWALGLTLFSIGFIVGALLLWLNQIPKSKELKETQKTLKKTEEERDALEETVRENSQNALKPIDNTHAND